MRGVIIALLILNLALAALGLAGVFSASGPAAEDFDPEVPGFRGRLLELADDVIEPDPFPLLPATGVCFLATGFDDATAAAAAARRWLDQGRLVTLLQRRAAGEVSGFQVVTPPMATRDERVRAQRSLASLGFDAHLVAAGEYAERVSLGVFGEPESARELLERLSAAGFEAEIVELRDDRWTQAVAGPLDALPPEAELEPTGATAQPYPCAEIAADWSRG